MQFEVLCDINARLNFPVNGYTLNYSIDSKPKSKILKKGLKLCYDSIYKNENVDYKQIWYRYIILGYIVTNK